MLNLTNVGKRFGAKIILRGISLRVPAGSISLLVGPNGAGKSTLMDIMAGLSEPDAGTIDRSCPPQKLAYLGHATCLYPNLTACENLAFWEGLAGGDTSMPRLRAMLERVGLGHFANERAGTFSRGMAQRLNLARVLLRDPQILLLDEPATGLDSAGNAQLHAEIRAAKNRGAAIVWITHSPEDDRLIADSVFELAHSMLIYNGPASAWQHAVAKPEPETPGSSSHMRPPADSGTKSGEPA